MWSLTLYTACESVWWMTVLCWWSVFKCSMWHRLWLRSAVKGFKLSRRAVQQPENESWSWSESFCLFLYLLKDYMLICGLERMFLTSYPELEMCLSVVIKFVSLSCNRRQLVNTEAAWLPNLGPDSDSGYSLNTSSVRLLLVFFWQKVMHVYSVLITQLGVCQILDNSTAIVGQ